MQHNIASRSQDTLQVAIILQDLLESVEPVDEPDVYRSGAVGTEKLVATHFEQNRRCIDPDTWQVVQPQSSQNFSEETGFTKCSKVRIYSQPMSGLNVEEILSRLDSDFKIITQAKIFDQAIDQPFDSLPPCRFWFALVNAQSEIMTLG